MDYKDYNVSDFLANESFVRWCVGNDKELSKQWKEWLASNPDKKEEFQEAYRICSLMSFATEEISDERVESIRNNIYKGIQSKNRSSLARKASGIRNIFEKHFYKVIAFAAVLVFITTAYFINFYKENLVMSSADFGQTKEILLPDGSMVKLNSNSSISYSQSWDIDDEREVWIKGEAFFTVQHKKNNQKFVVHSSDVIVEVLGTQFNVNNRKGITKVILNSGKVKLSESKKEKTLVMSPGELVEFHAEKGTFNKQLVEAEVATSWRNNKLIFSNTPLISIAATLEDNYGFNIRFSDNALASKKFTGTVPAKDVEILITSIAESFNLNVKRNKNNIVFIKK